MTAFSGCGAAYPLVSRSNVLDDADSAVIGLAVNNQYFELIIRVVLILEIADGLSDKTLLVADRYYDRDFWKVTQYKSVLVLLVPAGVRNRPVSPQSGVSAQ